VEKIGIGKKSARVQKTSSRQHWRKNRQTTESIKKCKNCTLIGSKFAYRFFPLFIDFSRFFPIFADFFEGPIFWKIAIFSGRKIDTQKKSRFFRTSSIFCRFFPLWSALTFILNQIFNVEKNETRNGSRTPHEFLLDRYDDGRNVCVDHLRGFHIYISPLSNPSGKFHKTRKPLTKNKIKYFS
jgi:hypothetical protein